MKYRHESKTNSKGLCAVFISILDRPQHPVYTIRH